MLLVRCLLHSHLMQKQHAYNVVCSYYSCLDDDMCAIFRAVVCRVSMWQILHAPKHCVLYVCPHTHTTHHLHVPIHTNIRTRLCTPIDRPAHWMHAHMRVRTQLW